MVEIQPARSQRAAAVVGAVPPDQRLALPRAAALIVAMSLAAWGAIAVGWRLLM